MATTTAPRSEAIPLANIALSSDTEQAETSPRPPSPSHVHQTPNTDLEAGPSLEPDSANDAEALPAYKEHDMEEPLPPYMARVRQVMRRERPLSTIMPNKREGRWVVGAFVLAVFIIIAVSIGVRGGAEGRN